MSTGGCTSSPTRVSQERRLVGHVANPDILAHVGKPLVAGVRVGRLIRTSSPAWVNLHRIKNSHVTPPDILTRVGKPLKVHQDDTLREGG